MQRRPERFGEHTRANMAERQEALREFVAVTGTEDDRARFFLESAGWDLQVGRAARRAASGGPGAARRGRPARPACGGRSAPSSRRAAARHRPQGPAAACHASELSGVAGKRGAAPALPGPAWPRVPLLPLRFVGPARRGPCSHPVGTGPGGVAAAPRPGRKMLGRRPGRETRGARGGRLFPCPTAGGGRSRARNPAHAPSHLMAGRSYLPPGRRRPVGMCLSFLATLSEKWKSLKVIV